MGKIVNSTFVSLDGVINHMDRPNTTVLNDDLAEAVTKVKQATGRTILMHGYGPVAKTLSSGVVILSYRPS